MQLIEYGKNDIGAELDDMSETVNKKLCPFIQEPQDNCHIVAMDSLKVAAVIYYCANNFKKCEIYQSLVKGKK